jgi:GNAT superfamily N-acetyltransferase
VSCAFDPGVEIVAEEKLFGGAPPGITNGVTLGAWINNDVLVGVVAWAGRWLRLLAVHPDHRGRRIGTDLLDDILARARAAGETRLRIGDAPGNYLSPGIDERNDALLEFLERRAFHWCGATENLAVPLVDNPLITAARSVPAGYTIERISPATRDATLAAANTFSPAWRVEVARAADDVHIAIAASDRSIAAFAAHDGNNRGLGWFGPAGTHEAHRGKGLGAALLLRCLLDIRAAGRERAVIAWIGPREFYEKTCGAVSDRRFVHMERRWGTAAAK